MQHYNNPEFKTIDVDNMINLKPNHPYVYKVYMARKLGNDRVTIVVAAETSFEANSMIDNEEYAVITDDYFTNQYSNNKGVIGEGQMPNSIYNSLKVKK